MTENTTIRPADDADLAALEALYPAAFPDEDLWPTVRALSEIGPVVQSIVATQNDNVVGHVMFTDCAVEGSDAKLSLLAPLCITPNLQKQGIGSGLVRHGLELGRGAGVDAVLVLGDPNYYGRFGFEMESRILTPYPLPDEWAGAWQSIVLTQTALPEGKLRVPAPWDHETLWSG